MVPPSPPCASSARPPGSRRLPVLLYAAVAAAAVLPYLNTLANGFTIDDRYLVLDNTGIRSLANLPSFFAGSWGGSIQSIFYGPMNAAYYRPLAMTLYAVEHAAFGYAPLGWHATSVLLHLIASLLVCALACKLVAGVAGRQGADGDDPRVPGRADLWSFAPLLAGVLFAVHPVHAEAVNPATYQTTLLAAIGALSAVHLHLGRPSLGRAIATAVAFLLAVLAKEEAIVVPVLLLLADLLLRQGPPARRLSVTAYALLALVAIGYLALRASLLRQSSLSFFGDAPRAVVFFTMLKVLLLDVHLLLFPHPLCSFYDWYVLPPAESMVDAEVVGGLGLLLLVPAAVVLLARSGRRREALALAWIPLALLPMAQIVPILNVAAERFLYLPSVGFCLLIGLVAGRAGAGWTARAGAAVSWPARPGRRAAAVLAACLALAALTWLRNRDWRDDETLNLASARDYPETPVPHINLAAIYESRGQTEKALERLATARSLDSRLRGPWVDAVRILLDQGRVDEAEALWRAALAAGIGESYLPRVPPRPP